MKYINEWTLEEFHALPLGDAIGKSFSSLIILPAPVNEEAHDSGYRCMYFVGEERGKEPTYKFHGGSDVVHIDGIGGFGHNWLEKYGTVPKPLPPTGWSIDCLRASGLLRLFPSSRELIVDDSMCSSFEVYAK